MQNANEIIKGLWIGDMHSATDINFMKRNNIRAVVNCTPDVPTMFTGVDYIRLTMNDTLKQKDIEDMIKYLPYAVKFIYDKKREGKNILVHCHAGMQRSATIVVAYLSAVHKLKILDAVMFVINKRPQAFHYGKHMNFAKSLEYFTN